MENKTGGRQKRGERARFVVRPDGDGRSSVNEICHYSLMSKRKHFSHCLLSCNSDQSFLFVFVNFISFFCLNGCNFIHLSSSSSLFLFFLPPSLHFFLHLRFSLCIFFFFLVFVIFYILKFPEFIINAIAHKSNLCKYLTNRFETHPSSILSF